MQDIYKSYYGEVLIYNLHIIQTIDQILSTIPKQKLGFYLLENQGWEKCLNIMWKDIIIKHWQDICIQQ